MRQKARGRLFLERKMRNFNDFLPQTPIFIDRVQSFSVIMIIETSFLFEYQINKEHIPLISS